MKWQLLHGSLVGIPALASCTAAQTLTTGHIHGVQAAALVMTAKVASAVVRGVDLKRQIREVNAATCGFAPLS